MYCEFYYFHIFETRPRSSARQYESIWTLIAHRTFWSPHLKICHSNVLVVKQTRYSIDNLKLYSNSRIIERTWYFVGVGGITRLGPKAYLTVLLFCRIDVFLLFRRLSWGTAACCLPLLSCFLLLLFLLTPKITISSIVWYERCLMFVLCGLITITWTVVNFIETIKKGRCR